MSVDATVLRRSAGFAAGVLTAVVELAVLPALILSRRLRSTGVRRLTALENRRRTVFFADPLPGHRDDGRALRYLAARAGAGLLSAVVLALLAIGSMLAALLVRGLLRGSVSVGDLLPQLVLGGVLLFLDVQGVLALDRLDARLPRRWFGPSEPEILRQRIAELAASRAGVVRAVDAERRRIERDLHDGVQQHLVALAVLLGRARRHRDPALLDQAHRAAEDALVELREVAWRAYPSALDELGLPEALAGVAERAPIPVRVRVDLAAPLPPPVRTAAYFVVSEAVTNAVKHAGATAVTVDLDGRADGVRIKVVDDGAGGADPAGTGLSGLRLRVAALDGTMAVASPAGGPTEITVEMPCG